MSPNRSYYSLVIVSFMIPTLATLSSIISIDPPTDKCSDPPNWNQVPEKVNSTLSIESSAISWDPLSPRQRRVSFDIVRLPNTLNDQSLQESADDERDPTLQLDLPAIANSIQFPDSQASPTTVSLKSQSTPITRHLSSPRVVKEIKPTDQSNNIAWMIDPSIDDDQCPWIYPVAFLIIGLLFIAVLVVLVVDLAS